MSENLLRAFDEEALGIAAGLEERNCNGFGFGFALKLGRRAPVGAALIDRIEDDIAAVGRVKLAHELARRVVNNGAVTTLRYLAENLTDNRRFA